jgi:hypothetical protein
VVVVATIFLLEIRGNRPEPEELEESDNEMSEDEEDQSFSEILKVFH